MSLGGKGLSKFVIFLEETLSLFMIIIIIIIDFVIVFAAVYSRRRKFRSY
jgi:hypothetical protein